MTEQFNPFYLLHKEQIDMITARYPNHTALADLIEHIKQQAIQLEEAQKTLEWYADESNHEMVETRVNEYSTETTSAAWQDSGERARDTLKRLRGDQIDGGR